MQEYIAAMPAWKSDVGRRVDEIVSRAVPDVRKAVKGNSPVYGIGRQGWFLSFRCFGKYVKLTFLNGASLEPLPPGESPHKQGRCLQIHENEEIDEAQLTDWAKQASAIPRHLLGPPMASSGGGQSADRQVSRSGRRTPLGAGATALTLLSNPHIFQTLRALEQGPTPLRELMRVLGSPPQSTTRIYLSKLCEIGAIERRSKSEFPKSVDCEITPGGLELLRVAESLQDWLDRAAVGPLKLGSPEAKRAVKALVGGWSTNIIRALARQRLSLTGLDQAIRNVPYPTLALRLNALRDTDLVEAPPGPRRAKPYAPTEWLRRAAAPVLAALCWERIHIRGSTTPIGHRDIECVFLLAVPLLELSTDLSGECQLAVEVDNAGSSAVVGVHIALEHGEVVSCLPGLEGQAAATVSGDLSAWQRQIGGGPGGDLKLVGKRALGKGLVTALDRAFAKR